MTKTTAALCRVDDCGRAVVFVRSQLCGTHRRQFRAGEPFTAIQMKVTPGGPCSFGPCDKPSKNLGYCKTHYDQQRQGRTLRIVTKRSVPITQRDPDGNKWCSSCETWLGEPDFASSVGKADGLQSRCRPCNAAIYRTRVVEIRDKMRMQRFKMTRAAFDAMLEAQGFACAICRSTSPGSKHWHVDHDHRCCPESGRSCGKCVRGLLCGPCNAGIGQLRDDPTILEAAADYLRSSQRIA